ncbi:MAG: stalk domain-containing protein [Eubacteriales bacterium]|jgi:poly(3-hydroxybutyrate) depolymerase
MSNNKIKLVPGNPVTVGDANHRHPPGDILNIKGFYDQDSHIMPDTVKECSGELVKGHVNRWVEYVPSCYDGKTPVPLVISQHGGGQSGWGQCYATSWYLVAEREGFIVIFPDAPDRKTVEEKRSGVGQDFFDINNEMLIALIDEMKKKYNIDESRIFMQGMSMGDLETTNFARKHSKLLAGGGCSAGPTNPDNLFDENGKPRENVGPVPIYQARGTYDNMSIDKRYTRWEINKANRHFWMEINGCSNNPLIGLDSGECIAYYRGEHADLVYRDVHERGHGQTIDCAERAWQLLFKHTRRNSDGSIERGEIPEFYDRYAVAIASDCEYAYVDNEKVPVHGKVFEIVQTIQVPKAFLEGKEIPQGIRMEELEMVEKEIGRHIYTPAKFLETAFGAEVTVDGETAVIKIAGREIQIAKGNTAAIVDGLVERMWRFAEWIDGEPYISIDWIARKILRKHVCHLDGVMYINDKPCTLTPDFVNIFREILG